MRKPNYSHLALAITTPAVADTKEAGKVLRPDWLKLYGYEPSTPRPQEFVSVTRHTADLAQSALRDRMEKQYYHNDEAACRELNDALAQPQVAEGKEEPKSDDAARVDWWILLTRYHRTVRVYECETPKGEKYWCCELTQPYERFCGPSPRDAIDVARGIPDAIPPVPQGQKDLGER